MAKDARALREEAAEATAAGKHKRALAAYLELERLEPRDAQWAKRAGESYRRLGNDKHAVDAFVRSAERYAQNGFLVQAIAVCKLILQIDPQHGETLQRLARMNEMRGSSPTRTAAMAENNPALHENPAVEAIRRRSTVSPSTTAAPPSATGSVPAITRTPSSLGTAQATRMQTTLDTPAAALPAVKPAARVVVPQPQPVRPAPSPMPTAVQPTPQPVQRPTSQPPFSMSRAQTAESIRKRQSTPPAMSRTKSKPISLPPGAGIDAVELRTEVADAYPRESSKGIHVIPIDDVDPDAFDDRASTPIIEVDDADELSSPIEVEVEEELLELADDDIEEIPLPEPRAIGSAAQRALAATPLFADLPSETLEMLVENLAIVTLEQGEVLFREGDIGDALYVIVEGEVAVISEGPPRVEMARLGPGSFIGEIALMTDQPRSATVIGVLFSELLRIDRGSLARVLSDHGDLLRAVLRFVRHRLVDRWMRTSPLTRVFSEEEREILSSNFNFLEIEPGSKLISAGAKPDGLYIILSGSFVVERGGQTVATLGAGHFIGETALLSGKAFQSDVTARGKGLALCLPATAFREMVMQHPHVLEYIGEQAELSRRLQIL